MSFRASIRILLASLLVSGAAPVLAGTTDAAALEARVERLLWQLVNDERQAQLPVAANYERLRGALLDQACLVSAAPCAALDRMTHEGRAMTTEITPEQVELIEQLLFSLRDARAAPSEAPVHLLVTTAE